MSQKYYTPSASAPSLSSQTGDAEVQKETAFTAVERVVAAKGSETQTTYAECRDRIADGIDKTTSIITELKAANKQTWVVRYPTFKAPEPSEGRRPSFRHSLSFADDPTQEIPVNLNRGPGNMTRSVTLATIPDEEQTSATTDDPSSDTKDRLLPADFNVLRLDLKLGPAGSPTTAASLVSQLEKTSIANLLDERLDRALERLDKLRCRIQDTSSKVLVTGDLNAGKSTFVNALLGRDVMPVDQQPCTTMFCEVHDASENDGVEEAHVVNEGATYSRDDESTFTRVSLSNLEGVVSESDAEHVLKLYIKDTRNPSQSLLNNGVVDISLIDAPGLNRDSLGTTQLFARQEEIDVVVFVVSAENHFTLSGKEFLFNANNEKAYLFIVVNKFDHIRDKAKCKRLILEQLKHLSPRTWKEADDLVHFIDSNATSSRTASGSEATKSSVPAESWDTMEESLRSFVLVKRAKSKLMPATTYLVNILDDVELLVSANDIVAQHEFKQAQDELE
ncbi:mitofusin, partial [Tulasnella sp. 403]